MSGRVFTGEFQALDKQGNLVLGHAVEHIGSDTRSVGMVLVPPKQRLSVEAKVRRQAGRQACPTGQACVQQRAQSSVHKQLTQACVECSCSCVQAHSLLAAL